jgi:hypothetical protein
MTNGLCDVKDCRGLPLLGWRPLTERTGRKVCEHHWLRHKDDKDSFDLYDEFKFRRPEGIRKPIAEKEAIRCSCGQELLPRRMLCAECAAERERQRKKRAYHERKNPEPIEQENILRCRACGQQRKPGHTYCSKCSQRRSEKSNRERQRRHYRKRKAG